MTDRISMPPPGRLVSTSTTRRLLELFAEQGPADPRVLLHGADGGSGILADPAAGRLARLQRLHHGHQADQGVHRRRRAGARSRATWTSSWPSTCMEMAEQLDHVVLFSGDGDFRRLVEAVQRKGVRVTWSARSGRSRRWSPTSCAARPTTSSSCRISRRRSRAQHADRERPGARCMTSGRRTTRSSTTAIRRGRRPSRDRPCLEGRAVAAMRAG